MSFLAFPDQVPPVPVDEEETRTKTKVFEPSITYDDLHDALVDAGIALREGWEVRMTAHHYPQPVVLLEVWKGVKWQ